MSPEQNLFLGDKFLWLASAFPLSQHEIREKKPPFLSVDSLTSPIPCTEGHIRLKNIYVGYSLCEHKDEHGAVPAGVGMG